MLGLFTEILVNGESNLRFSLTIAIPKFKGLDIHPPNIFYNLNEMNVFLSRIRYLYIYSDGHGTS